jgi:hypothetical protein
LNFYTTAKLKLGATKIRDYYILDDGWVLETPFDAIDDEKLTEVADNVRGIINTEYSKEKEFIYISAANKETSLNHLYPSYLRKLNKSIDNRNIFQSKLEDTGMKFVNIEEHFLSNFSTDYLESLYFKLDHHWNGKGAVEGFKYIVNQLGLEEYVDWNDYTTYTLTKGNFVGSYSRKLNKSILFDEDIEFTFKKNTPDYKFYLWKSSETIELDTSEFIATGIDKEQMTYSEAFMLDSICNVLKVKNESAPLDKKIIIFKDSYQVPTTWLFADIFKEVNIVDFRYLNKSEMRAQELIEFSEADMVLFMYNDVDFVEMLEMMY